MVVKHRSRLERRVYRARKIRQRRMIARKTGYLNSLLELDKGRLAKRLWYPSRLDWEERHDTPLRSDVRNKERFNHELKEYYYENVSESKEV